MRACKSHDGISLFNLLNLKRPQRFNHTNEIAQSTKSKDVQSHNFAYIIASDFDGLAVLKELDETIQILEWNIGPACQVAEFMGTKWLAACRELDTESTGVKGAV